MRSRSTIQRAILVLSIVFFSALAVHTMDLLKRNQVLEAELIRLNNHNRATTADRELYKDIARDLVAKCINSDNIKIQNRQYRCYQIYNL